MASDYGEFHENVKEYFPLNEKVKGKNSYSSLSSGAVSALASLATVGVAAAIVVFALLHLNCVPVNILANSALFDVQLYDATEESNVNYVLLLDNEALEQEEDIELLLDESLDTDSIPEEKYELQLDNLSPGTDYLLVFYELNADGTTRLLERCQFTTLDVSGSEADEGGSRRKISTRKGGGHATGESFSVSFDMGGHGTQVAAQTVDSGEVATDPGTQEEEGYLFSGWYSDPECTVVFDFSSPVTADTSVYAGWTIVTYTVSFDMGGHGEQAEAQTVDYGAAALEPEAPQEDGYTFCGWYTDTDYTGEFDFTAPVTGDITVYAKWEIITCAVTFDMGGHGEQPETQTVDYGTAALEPEAPQEDGYTFCGWYADADYTGEFDFTATVTGDITVYAKWEIITCTVSFDMGGHGTQIDAQTVDYGACASTPSKPTAYSYSFGGWYTDSGCKTAYDFSTPVTEDLTLYAKWNWISRKYTVTFVMHGHGDDIPSQTVTYGSKAVEPETPNEIGFAFAGWYTDKEFSQKFNFNTAIKSDTILYAAWVEAVVYTVSFDLGSIADPIPDVEVNSGDTAVMPEDPAADGYIFGGWYLNADKTLPFDPSTPIESDLLLYAKWDIDPAPTGQTPQVVECFGLEGDPLNVFCINVGFDLNDTPSSSITALTLYVTDYYGTRSAYLASGDFDFNEDNTVSTMGYYMCEENATLTIYAVLSYTDTDGAEQTVEGPTLAISCGGLSKATGSVVITPVAGMEKTYDYTVTISGIRDGDGRMQLDDVTVSFYDGDLIGEESISGSSFTQNSDGSWTYSGQVVMPSSGTSAAVSVSGTWKYELDGTEEDMLKSQKSFIVTLGS